MIARILGWIVLLCLAAGFVLALIAGGFWYSLQKRYHYEISAVITLEDRRTEIGYLAHCGRSLKGAHGAFYSAIEQLHVAPVETDQSWLILVPRQEICAGALKDWLRGFRFPFSKAPRPNSEAFTVMRFDGVQNLSWPVKDTIGTKHIPFMLGDVRFTPMRKTAYNARMKDAVQPLFVVEEREFLALFYQDAPASWLKHLRDPSYKSSNGRWHYYVHLPGWAGQPQDVPRTLIWRDEIGLHNFDLAARTDYTRRDLRQLPEWAERVVIPYEGPYVFGRQENGMQEIVLAPEPLRTGHFFMRPGAALPSASLPFGNAQGPASYIVYDTHSKRLYVPAILKVRFPFQDPVALVK